MRDELRKKIVEENYYIGLLKNNPQYRLQGRQDKKVVVGIIKGDSSKYKETDHLNFMYFDSWKEAYIQLFQNQQ